MTAPDVAPPVAQRWRAKVETRRIYPRRLVERPDGEHKLISMPVDLLSVVLSRGEGERIAFHVCWPKGRLTLSDSRECRTGTAGSTGQWGTRPPTKPGKRRTLTPSAWVAEVSRLIGTDEAQRIVRSLSRGNPPL